MSYYVCVLAHCLSQPRCRKKLKISVADNEYILLGHVLHLQLQTSCCGSALVAFLSWWGGLILSPGREPSVWTQSHNPACSWLLCTAQARHCTCDDNMARSSTSRHEQKQLSPPPPQKRYTDNYQKKIKQSNSNIFVYIKVMIICCVEMTGKIFISYY